MVLFTKDEKSIRERALAAAVASANSSPSAHLSLARHYLIAGQKEKTLDSMEKALQAKVFVMPFVAVDPFFDPLRNDPRFQDILQRMNLTVK